MRQRKCDMGLDLGLCPYISLPCSSSSSTSSSSSSDATSLASPPKSHHHVAILHDGRACAFDLTELQARAILMMARREGESRDTMPPVSPKSRQHGSAYYMWRPRGISMKRSLQRFLQGRRSRRRHAQENTPYNNRITSATTNHHRTDTDNQN